MIKNIETFAPYLKATVIKEWVTETGPVWFNRDTQGFEVRPASGLVPPVVINGDKAEIMMGQTLETVIYWALAKMSEEAQMKDLCKKHPALDDAYERLQIIKTLVSETK